VAAHVWRREAQLVSIKPKGKWPLLLAIPEQVLSTEEARRVLPAHYSRGDAVINIQNSMMLLVALCKDVMSCSEPRSKTDWHQPYRARLCPLLPCLQELSGSPGILGAVLSGAGPSVVVFSRSSLFRPENQKSYCFLPCRARECRRTASYFHRPQRSAQ